MSLVILSHRGAVPLLEPALYATHSAPLCRDAAAACRGAAPVAPLPLARRSGTRPLRCQASTDSDGASDVTGIACHKRRTVKARTMAYSATTDTKGSWGDFP